MRRLALASLLALTAPIATGRASLPSTSAPPPSSAPTPASAIESTPLLGDTRYLAAPRHDADGEPPPPLPEVVYPRMGWPELVPYGGVVTIWLRGAGALDAAAYTVDLAEDDRVAGGPRYALRPLAVRLDAQQGIRVLTAQVPAAAPRDTYDLVVDGLGLSPSVIPHAVRIYGTEGGPFRFVFMADHQLWDPSWRIDSPQRNSGDYPKRGEDEANRAITRQEFAELELLDPDFVLDGGDMVFGLRIATEYAEMARLWRDLRLPTFVVPGNHDGYADYHLHFNWRAAPAALARAALCAADLGGVSHLADLRDLSWRKVSQFLLCAYGDLTAMLFKDPSEDGLDFFRATFGPVAYAFEHGNVQFIGANSYGGTPERRHAFSIFLDAFDLHLGAPAVDNYGGFLDDAMLAWIDKEAALGVAGGRRVLLFEHHDPRGELADSEQRYAEDHPFPTDPLSLEGFQEWNFDDRWSSDAAHPRVESPTRNSGTRLLDVIARRVDYVLTAHIHGDSYAAMPAGAEVAPGVALHHPVSFLRVTTAASSLHAAEDYWGYRLLAADSQGEVDFRPFDAGHALASVPAGNLWQTAPVAGGDGTVRCSVVNGLPQPVAVVVRLILPVRPAGYVITHSGVEAPVSDVEPWADGKSATYFVPTTVGATSGAFPPDPRSRHSETFVATPAPGPETLESIAVEPGPGAGPAGLGAPASQPSTRATVGTTPTLAIARPQGAPLLEQVSWSVTAPGGSVTEARVPRLALPLTVQGRFLVQALTVDAHGAIAHLSMTILSLSPPPAPVAVEPPVQRGCACSIGSPDRGAAGGTGLWALLALAGGVAVCRRARAKIGASGNNRPGHPF